MNRFAIGAVLAAAFAAGGCAPRAAVKPADTITLAVDASGNKASDPDLQKVVDALKMIHDGGFPARSARPFAVRATHWSSCIGSMRQPRPIMAA